MEDGKWFYAGIGSRETPSQILEAMEWLGAFYAHCGYTLRSGGARGADSAFERGCRRLNGPKEIFLAEDESLIKQDWVQALVDQYHPTPHRLSAYARKLVARNGLQIFGARGDQPVRFVLCYTPNAQGSGGTGQAIRISRAYDIPVYDLGDEEFYQRVLDATRKI